MDGVQISRLITSSLISFDITSIRLAFEELLRKAGAKMTVHAYVSQQRCSLTVTVFPFERDKEEDKRIRKLSVLVIGP